MDANIEEEHRPDDKSGDEQVEPKQSYDVLYGKVLIDPSEESDEDMISEVAEFSQSSADVVVEVGDWAMPLSRKSSSESSTSLEVEEENDERGMAKGFLEISNGLTIS